MKLPYYLAIVTVIFSNSLVVYGETSKDSLSASYTQLVKADHDNLKNGIQDRIRAMKLVYEQEFRKILPSLSEMTHEDLDYFSRAASKMSFYTNDPTYLSDLQEISKTSAGEDTEFARRYYAALIQFRAFGEARELFERHKDANLEVPPKVISLPSGRPNAYEVLPGNSLREVAIPMKGDVLVTIVHPNCGFSVRAMEGIDNATLPKRLNVVWLAPVGRTIDHERLLEWNSTHSQRQILLATRVSDWKMLDHWETPTFYLLRDGSVIKSFSGWPSDGHLEQLKELISASSP